MRIGIILPIEQTARPAGAVVPGHPRDGRRGRGGRSRLALDLRPSPLPVRGRGASGLHEAWTILSAVADATERVELGTLVMCTTFRNPGVLAKMAATLDHVSGGRLILGIGAGWHDPEYEAFGFPTDHKVGRFDEAFTIIRDLDPHRPGRPRRDLSCRPATLSSSRRRGPTSRSSWRPSARGCSS